MLALTAPMSGQATSADIMVRAVAEVRTTTVENGIAASRLVPATRVTPGDEVIYTLEVRNAGRAAVRSPTVTYPVPAHLRLVADSATGPGAEVSYSVDGGLTFGAPEDLRLTGQDGRQRLATPNDYTHIRWKLKNTLKSNSVAFMRFRAVVK